MFSSLTSHAPISFTDLNEQQILALAITAEEEDSRIYRAFASRLIADYPATASVFKDMAKEEGEHRARLYALYRERFGQDLLLIRRTDVKGFLRRKPVWLQPHIDIAAIRAEVASMEAEAAAFYRKAAEHASDLAIRELLMSLAETEEDHESTALALETSHLPDKVAHAEEEHAHQKFVLQYVQPGLAGLMDGSVSTLAPLFAAAFATHNNWDTLLVGLAASVGAGISMGFAEALSDDGQISGRGSPLVRGWVCGLMTTIGGLGHALPYLIPNSWPNAFWIATAIASLVVAVELAVIAWIRWKYMDTPIVKAVIQIVVGGALVLLAGIALGSA